MKPGVHKIVSRLSDIKKSIGVLTAREVAVGVPRAKAGRSGKINNAALLYIHENGAPEVGIPARRTLHPGIEDVRGEIKRRFDAVQKAAFQGRAGSIEAGLSGVGMIAASSVKNRINSNTPPPLKSATVANRFRQRGTKTRRKAEDKYLDLVRSGIDPGTAQTQAGIVSLINTGQMRNAVTYVVRKRGG